MTEISGPKGCIIMEAKERHYTAKTSKRPYKEKYVLFNTCTALY